MMMETNGYKLTSEGLNILEERLKEAEETMRQTLWETQKVANDQGNYSEDAFYLECLRRIGMLGEKIRKLKKMIREAVVVKEEQRVGIVGMGTRVVIEITEERTKNKEVLMVSIRDSVLTDPLNGDVSFDSPLAKALIGTSEGGIGIYQVEGNVFHVKVLSVL